MTRPAMDNSAPGWYPDPKDPSGVRWFDGRFWTEHNGPSPIRQVPPTVDEPSRRRPRVLLAGGITAGVVLLGLLATAAVPTYREARERVRLEPVTSTTCDDVADEAIELGRTVKELEPLKAVASAAVARDDRDLVRIPEPGAEAFVMSCTALGTRTDGSVAPLTIDLYIDHERTHLLWYTWDT